MTGFDWHVNWKLRNQNTKTNTYLNTEVMRRNVIYMDPGVGKILVSEPFLLDSYFKRAVILLAESRTEPKFVAWS